MVRNTPLEDIPPYLKAVTFLEPIGNITAETSWAVQNMRPLSMVQDQAEHDDEPAQYHNVLVPGIILGIAGMTALVFIALVASLPIAKWWDRINFAVPPFLAAVTYSVFSWLDSNASDETTKVLTSWLNTRSQYKPDLGNLIISAFDRVYTYPLLTVTAFCRSAFISTVVWLLVFFIPWFVRSVTILINQHATFLFYLELISYIFVSWLLIVSSDYFSLLLVRPLLDNARKQPIKASFNASLLGLIVVGIVTYIFTTFYIKFSNVATLMSFLFGDPATIHLLDVSYSSVAPALVIHLWLPLFALSSLSVKTVYWIFRATNWAQWFLIHGDAHPFRAIGVVATIIVFGSTMLVKEAWTVL